MLFLKAQPSLFPSPASPAPARSPESNDLRMNWLISLQTCFQERQLATVPWLLRGLRQTQLSGKKCTFRVFFVAPLGERWGTVAGSMRLQPGCLRVNPGSDKLQPCDPGQDLILLIRRTGAMMIRIVSASKVCCKNYTNRILA